MGLFSSEPHPVEKLVKEATDEKLTSEDWTRFIAVCDEINVKPAKNGPLAIEALRTRLGSKNGNVQLYSLSLMNTIAQNCGPLPRKEIASVATVNVLQKLGTNPQTHRSVLTRLMDVLSSLAAEFSNDRTLSQIELLYDRLSKAHPNIGSGSGSSQPTSSNRSNSSAPRQSTTQGMRSNTTTNVARSAPPPVDDDDDEDLKRAIELSIQESQPPTSAKDVALAAQVPDSTPKTYVKGLYDFNASEDGELSFQVGDVIEVLDRVYKEWWKGYLDGREGIFPVTYVEPYEPQESNISSGPYDTSNIASQSSGNLVSSSQSSTYGLSTSSGVARADATPVMDETYLFAQVPAVERLLTILASASQDGSGSSVINNPDVQHLYHQISAMRPRLVQLIDEYATKKDELVEMNQKLVSARRTYENLVSQAASGQHRVAQNRNAQPSAPAPVQPSAPSQSYQQPSYQQPSYQQQPYSSQPQHQPQHQPQPVYQHPPTGHPQAPPPTAAYQQTTYSHGAVPGAGYTLPVEAAAPYHGAPVFPAGTRLSTGGSIPATPNSYSASNTPQPYAYQNPPQPSHSSQHSVASSGLSEASSEYYAQHDPAYGRPPVPTTSQPLPYPDGGRVMQSPYTNGVVTPSAPQY